MYFDTVDIEGYFIRIVFFFFQAEDGIRDADVTGVQTCALPISSVISTNSMSPPSCSKNGRNCSNASLTVFFNASIPSVMLNVYFVISTNLQTNSSKASETTVDRKSVV